VFAATDAHDIGATVLRRGRLRLERVPITGFPPGIRPGRGEIEGLGDRLLDLRRLFGRQIEVHDPRIGLAELSPVRGIRECLTVFPRSGDTWSGG